MAIEGYPKSIRELIIENNLSIHGMISLERGSIFTSMILASISVFLIEKNFLMACIWSLGAALLSFVGIIHAYEITPNGIVSIFGCGVASDFSIGYCSFAIHFYMHGNNGKSNC